MTSVKTAIFQHRTSGQRSPLKLVKALVNEGPMKLAVFGKAYTISIEK